MHSVMLLLLLAVVVTLNSSLADDEDADSDKSVAQQQLLEMRRLLRNEVIRRGFPQLKTPSKTDEDKKPKEVTKKVKNKIKKVKVKKVKKKTQKREVTSFAKQMELARRWRWILLSVACLVVLLCLLCFLLLVRRRWSARQSGGRDVGDFARQKDDFLTFGELHHCMKQQGSAQITFSLEFDIEKEVLEILVHSCQRLPLQLDDTTPPDPFVQVHLRHRKFTESDDFNSKHLHQSKKVLHTCNPVFNFSCHFKVSRKELQFQIVQLDVFDWSDSRHCRMLGLAFFSFTELSDCLETIVGRSRCFTKKLKPGIQTTRFGPGDICVSLQVKKDRKKMLKQQQQKQKQQQPHHPALLTLPGQPQDPVRLIVSVVECKGVFLVRGDAIDKLTLPNVKVRVDFKTTNRSKVIWTNKVCGSRNPYFNAKLEFQLLNAELPSSSLRFTAFHCTETLGIRSRIGAVEIGAFVDPETSAGAHFTRAVRKSPEAEAHWHNLLTDKEENKLRHKWEKRQRQMQETQEAAGDLEPSTSGTCSVNSSSR